VNYQQFFPQLVENQPMKKFLSTRHRLMNGLDRLWSPRVAAWLPVILSGAKRSRSPRSVAKRNGEGPTEGRVQRPDGRDLRRISDTAQRVSYIFFVFEQEQ
jgi:hypothetical protein